MRFRFLFCGFAIAQMAQPGTAIASSDIAPLDAKVTYTLPSGNSISLSCLAQPCRVEGMLGGKKFEFEAKDFAPGRQVEPYFFQVFLKPDLRKISEVSFSAQVSISCGEGGTEYICLSEFVVHRGQLRFVDFSRKKLVEMDRVQILSVPR